MPATRSGPGRSAQVREEALAERCVVVPQPGEVRPECLLRWSETRDGSIGPQRPEARWQTDVN